MVISSYGTINYSTTPSPTPTPTPQGNNIAVIPSYWNDPNAWGLRSGGYCHYPVSYQGETCVKISRNPDYVSDCAAKGWYDGVNEVDGYKVAVSSGDHVVFSVWIWTEPSTIGRSGVGWSGCDIMVDAYQSTSGGRICELDWYTGVPTMEGEPHHGERLIVPWGSGAWVQLKMDFYIRPTYVSESTGQPVVPGAIIPVIETNGLYIDSASTNEAANAYFYGTILYINPT
jgi:hypothetical protein